MDNFIENQKESKRLFVCKYFDEIYTMLQMKLRYQILVMFGSLTHRKHIYWYFLISIILF